MIPNTRIFQLEKNVDKQRKRLLSIFIGKTKRKKLNDVVSIEFYDFASEEMYAYVVPDFFCLKKRCYLYCQ